MHWADVVASELEKRWEAGGSEGRERFTIATGITPSGQIHVGNMREVLTGDAIYRACLDRGLPARLIYLGDDMDPLRKVYPFLDESYAEHVGKPLFDIPCPCGEHASYSEHFLEPFLESLERTGIDAEVVPVHEGYDQGRYAPAIRRLMDRRDEVASILTEVSGRELPEGWFPYTARCGSCGGFKGTRATGFEDPHVTYECECGGSGKANINTAQGKLPWRLEWPARWQNLDVFCEPFGKDHAASGGSYDSGSRIMREVLGGEPPHPVVYEWIQLKGEGVMSSSTGVVVTAADMLGMTPPQVLRFLIMRCNPSRHIDFDPGMGVLSLVDEYDRLERLYFGFGEGVDPEDQRRAFELSQVDREMTEHLRLRAGLDRELKSSEPPMDPPVQVPYKHLVTLWQIAGSWEGVRDLLFRNGGLRREELEGDEGAEVETRLRSRLEAVRFWLDRFAPDMVRFSLVPEVPEDVLASLGELDRQLARHLRDALGDADWNPEAIHTTVHETAAAMGIKAPKAFKLMYRLFLGQAKGPRLGYFLASLEKGYVLERLSV